MTPPATVSVILPTKDRWPRLSLALRSVLAQTRRDLEVIVVDDGSRDETPERLSRIRDPRVILLRRPVHGGVAPARNLGLRHAMGEWLAFIDDDDVWAPCKLERQLEVAARCHADLVVTSSLRVRPDGCVVSHMRPEVGGLERALVRWNVVGGPSSVAVRANAVAQVGGFDEQLAVLADWELWLRLARRCRPALVDEPLVGVLEHGASMQVVDIERVEAELRHLETRHRERIAELGLSFGGPELIEWVAYNRRRAGLPLPAIEGYLRLARYRPAYGLARVLACGMEKAIHRPLHSRRRAHAPPSWLVQALAAAVPSGLGSV